MLLSPPQIIKHSLVLVLFVGVPGCGSLTQPDVSLTSLQFSGDVTAIRDLQQKRSLNQTVYVKGKVGDRVPLVGKQIYELQDPTGSIWILTQHTPPNSGDEVVIKGQVRYQSIPLNGKEQGSIYVEQQEQVERTPTKLRSS